MTEVRSQKSDEPPWFFGYRHCHRSSSRPRRRSRTRPRPRVCIEHSRQELPFLEDEDEYEYEKNRIKSYAFALRPQPYTLYLLPLCFALRLFSFSAFRIFSRGIVLPSRTTTVPTSIRLSSSQAEFLTPLSFLTPETSLVLKPDT